MMDTTASFGKSVRTIQSEQCLIRFDAGRLPSVNSNQFNASGYAAAEPVTGSGGRGAAWFVSTQAGAAVLKHYRRGGLMAHLTARHYAYLGLERVRSMAEFELLFALHEKELQVPLPLAAFCARAGLTYRAALLTERIPEAASLARRIEQGNPPWAKVGTLIARFHRAGAEHRDLNIENILFAGDGRIFLIDWDKGRLHDGPGPWCGRVLARLRRSLEKHPALRDSAGLESAWQELMAAYEESMA
jgi:3-deoxy-D-manno-octulosonic acid kinase